MSAAGAIGAYMLIRWLIRLMEQSKPPARPVSSLKPPLLGLPSAGVHAPIIAPPPPRPEAPGLPVVQWTDDQELLAWRAWRLAFFLPNSGGDGGPRLLSLSAPCIWNGPVVQDGIPLATTETPSGIFAFKTSVNASQWQQCESCWVTGLIAVSGRVVEHMYGYRAERAVVRELRLGTGTHLAVRPLNELRRLIDCLANRYQVTVDVGQREREVADRMLMHGKRPQSPKVPFVWSRAPWRLI